MTESSERIGEDVLGGAPPSRMEKRKQELMIKAKKEVEKKKKAKEEEEDNIKLSKLPIPDDQHQLTPLERAEIEQRARVTGASFEHEKAVFVSEHYRSKPKRAKKKQEEKKRSFFEFP
jgi:hypothetical protein